MGQDNQQKHITSIILAVLAIPVLLFAPLVIHMVEWGFFDTDYTYRFFDSIGLADELDKVYEPVMEFLFKWLA